MTNAQLDAFRAIAADMHPEPHDHVWIGPYLSQRHFGITAVRARSYAAQYGGIVYTMAEYQQELDRVSARTHAHAGRDIASCVHEP